MTARRTLFTLAVLVAVRAPVLLAESGPIYEFRFNPAACSDASVSATGSTMFAIVPVICSQQEEPTLITLTVLTGDGVNVNATATGNIDSAAGKADFVLSGGDPGDQAEFTFDVRPLEPPMITPESEFIVEFIARTNPPNDDPLTNGFFSAFSADGLPIASGGGARSCWTLEATLM